MHDHGLITVKNYHDTLLSAVIPSPKDANILFAGGTAKSVKIQTLQGG